MEFDTKSNSLIYLDNNATTPLAEEVINGIKSSLINDWGNPSSGNSFGRNARVAIDKAREEIAKMLDCSPTEIILTSGGTEGNNMIIQSAVKYFKEQNQIHKRTNEKPHIITTNVEHDSVILPIIELQKNSIIDCTIVEVDNSGSVPVDNILSKITPETCLITVMYANNETGVIMPVPEIGEKITVINKKRIEMNLPKILYHTDAAQIIGKEKISFKQAYVDFLTVVGHKFYGPRIGCICAREKIFPLLFGGGQERGLRPGTENTPMIVGLGIASNLVSMNIDKYQRHLFECRDRLETKLKKVFGDEIVINCEGNKRLSNTCNVSFVSEGLEGGVVLSHCKKLVASVGAACHGQKCSQILINSGVPLKLAKNAIRLSVGRKTTFEEIDQVVSELESVVNKLKSNGKNY